jgi:hypothetical protein
MSILIFGRGKITFLKPPIKTRHYIENEDKNRLRVYTR